MPDQRHTRQSIVHTLQNVAARLGKTALSAKDVQPHLSLSPIYYHFGNLGTALKAAGLTMTPRDLSAIASRRRLDHQVLFASLQDVERKLGYAPNLSEYRANGGTVSYRTFKARFGGWGPTLQHYQKWKVDRGGSPPKTISPANVGDISMTRRADRSARAHSPAPAQSAARPRKPSQLYGEPIDFRGLRHAPINEQGVIYLFGIVSRELGFSVEALQQGFPDCQGKYLHDKNHKLWAKARIEFEFRASNFRGHGHNQDECDVIVCWENDWPDCPLRIVELKSEIMRLPSR
jgi:hypothetical protein